MNYILDTSVAVKWFTGAAEPDVKKALELRERHLRRIDTLMVPELFFVELGNALRFNPHFAKKNVEDSIQSALDMALEIARPQDKTLTRAIQIAFDYNTAVYDAYFLALSIDLKQPLITADNHFFKKVHSIPNVIRLSDIKIH